MALEVFGFILPLHHRNSLFYSLSGMIVNYHNDYLAPPIVESIAMLMRQAFENPVQACVVGRGG